MLCRIVTDRETGKQKGFAFIEYYEAQTAQSAVRNLDQADLTGRKLKVTFAQKDIDTVMRQSRGTVCFQRAWILCLCIFTRCFAPSEKGHVLLQIPAQRRPGQEGGSPCAPR